MSYHWSGILPTIDSFGQSVCSTISSNQNVPYNSYATPPQASPTSTDLDDPHGYMYKLISYGCYGSPDPGINPEDAAPKLCEPEVMCGVRPVQTVKFLTETSTTFENGNTEATPAGAPAQSAPGRPPTVTPASNIRPASNIQPAPTGSDLPSLNTPSPEAPVTSNERGEILVADQTLRVDGEVTLGSGSSRTSIALGTDDAGQTVAIIKGQSTAVVTAAATDIGGLIAAGLGSNGTARSEEFTGHAMQSLTYDHSVLAGLVLLICHAYAW